MAADGLDCCAVFAKIVLIILNIFYLLVSICLVGAGVYVLVNSNNIQEVTGSDLSTSAIIILVIGAATLVTSIFGLIGAATNFWPLLVVYCFIILILIGIQIAVGVLTFLYKGEIKKRVTPQLKLLLSNYTDDKSSPYYNKNRNDVINFIQKSFKCCGLLNATDWIGLNSAYLVENQGPPRSCVCQPSSERCKTYNVTIVQPFTISINVWKQGCVPAVEDYVHHNLISLGAGAVSFAVLQILTVIFTIGLCTCIIAKKKRDRNISRVQDLAYTPLEAYPTYPTNIFDPQRHSNQNYNQFHDEDDDGNVKMV